MDESSPNLFILALVGPLDLWSDMETSNDRLNNQIQFILEIDKLKSILRQNILTDFSRRENSAEHSWHLAIMAIFLAEHSPEPIELIRVVKMVLIHDLVEIDAGDAFCHDLKAQEFQGEKEMRAAQRIFDLLPKDQCQELWDIWREFESGETADAKFARALDRLQPLLLHEGTDHLGWRKHGITLEQILTRMKEVSINVPAFWPRIEKNIKEAQKTGALRASPSQ